MQQQTFAGLEYEMSNTKRVTRKEKFLAQMENVVPWGLLVATIAPFYHADRKCGRRPLPLILVLKMYFLQLWYSLSDENTEDTIYDSNAFQKFLGVNAFGAENVPDSTTLENFRHLLEENDLAQKLMDKVNEMLEKQGLIMHGGTITDATIMDAPSSTRNSKKQRDPEMKSTKKGKNYRFGGKLHTGTDAGSGAVVNATVTAANEHDITQAVHNYREDDDVRYGDAAFVGVEKRREIGTYDAFNAETRTQAEVRYETSKRPSSRKEKPENLEAINWEKVIEARKSATRWKVEYPYYILKRIFGINRCIYKGLKKNANRFITGLALVNLYMFRERLA